MTAVIEVALFVDELDEVEAVLRLHDLRYLPRFQLRKRVGEGLHEGLQRRRLHFAAVQRRTVDRIDTRQQVELGVARDDAFAHLQQTLARAALGLVDRLGELGDMGVDVLVADHGQAVLVGLAVESLHLAGDDRHLADHLALHSRSVGLLLVAAAQIFTDIEDRVVHLRLDGRNRPFAGDHILHLLLDAGHDVGLHDLHRVDERLIVKQLLHHQLFERLVHRVAVGGIALFAARLGQPPRGVLHFGVGDRRPAHDGHDLVQHHLLGPHAESANRQRSTTQNPCKSHIVKSIKSNCSCSRKFSPRLPPAPRRPAPPRANGSPRPAAG